MAFVYSGVPAEVAAGGAFPVTSVKTFTVCFFHGGKKIWEEEWNKKIDNVKKRR